jgi:hypothetical protein
MKTFKFLVFGITLLLFGCSSYINSSNPFKLSMRTVNDIKLKKSNHVTIYDYTEENVNYFLNMGYVVKAKSAFRNRLVNMSGVELAAKEIGSDVALYKREYVGTASGANVIPWYVPGETYTVKSSTNGSVSANGYGSTTVIGSDGYAVGRSSSSAYGTYNSNTTTTIQAPGRYEYYSIPYSLDYYDQYAVFLVKEQDALEAQNGKTNGNKIEIGQTYQIQDGIGLYTKPISSTSYMKDTSKKGDKVTVIERFTDFYKVEINGELLYIHTTNLYDSINKK